MLTRVFPFHPKNAVENALETCGGDVAKAVQQLVGHQTSPSASTPMEEGLTTSKSSNSISTNKSTLFSTANTPTFPSQPTSPSNNRPVYTQLGVPTSSSMSIPSTSTSLISYPSALRMMSSYPSAGMMSFLHPSAYFAAAASAAAAAASPHSYPWLFPGPYGSVRPLVQPNQHLCLPGCSVCPISTGTSSTSSSSPPSERTNGCGNIQTSSLMITPDDLFKNNGRKDVFQHSGN